MITALARIIRYGVQNFWRNGWLSAATILVMALAVMVFLALIIFGVVTNVAIQSLQDKIDISVYFKPEVSADDIANIEQAARALPEIKSVEYISREKALEIFKSRHKDDAAISQALEELGGNPLTASLNIQAKDPNEYNNLAAYFQSEKLAKSILKVTYSQNQLAIARLARIADAAKTVGLVITLILAFMAALVTFNTVRLAIYSSREEISIMRIVGASNAYIRGPYVVEGVLYGLVSAFLVFLVFIPLAHFSSPYISIFIPSFDLLAYFYGHLVGLVGYALLFGVALGIISSSIAITRYLRV